MNLCRFFRCEVFFLGTARSIDSQIPESIGGSLRTNAEGSATENREGSLEIGCTKKSADFDRIVGAANIN